MDAAALNALSHIWRDAFAAEAGAPVSPLALFRAVVHHLASPTPPLARLRAAVGHFFTNQVTAARPQGSCGFLVAGHAAALVPLHLLANGRGHILLKGLPVAHPPLDVALTQAVEVDGFPRVEFLVVRCPARICVLNQLPHVLDIPTELGLEVMRPACPAPR